jgi:hypothetical protein
VGLITRKDIATSTHTSPKIKDSFSRILPPHIITALQKWTLVTKEELSPPLDHEPTLLNTEVNTQEIRPSGQTATSSPPSSLISLFALTINHEITI